MTISMTENAARHVKKQLENRGKGIGLRLGVKKSGCSGFAYDIDFADELMEGDEVFEQYGVKLVVKGEHLEFLQGLELDYSRQGISEVFRFRNPNIKDSCGCGESFTV